MKTSIITLLVIIVAADAVWYGVWSHSGSSSQVAPSMPAVAEQSIQQPTNSVRYACDEGKTIDAGFYAGKAATSTAANGAPVPTGSVKVTLSDGRTMTLPQTISADGARYANGDESFVFWNKGNQALIMEDNQMSLAYTNCSDIGGQ